MVPRLCLARPGLYAADLHDAYPWSRCARPGRACATWWFPRIAAHAGRAAGAAARAGRGRHAGVDLAAFLKLEPETVALVARLDLLAADLLLLLPARITRRKNIEQAIAIVGALRRLAAPAPGRQRAAGAAQPVERGLPGPAQAGVPRQRGRRRGRVLYEAFVDEDGRPRPVADALLADLFKLADGLPMPSRAEVRHPLIEAGLAGIPIFCSDIAPFRESAGDAALRFDPRRCAGRGGRAEVAALRDDRRAARSAGACGSSTPGRRSTSARSCRCWKREERCAAQAGAIACPARRATDDGGRHPLIFAPPTGSGVRWWRWGSARHPTATSSPRARGGGRGRAPAAPTLVSCGWGGEVVHSNRKVRQNLT
jgi:hypothetical protein